MGLLSPTASIARDERGQVGAYITDSKRLLEVVQERDDGVLAIDCRHPMDAPTTRHFIALGRLAEFRLVLRAPSVPDSLD